MHLLKDILVAPSFDIINFIRSGRCHALRARTLESDQMALESVTSWRSWKVIYSLSPSSSEKWGYERLSHRHLHCDGSHRIEISLSGSQLGALSQQRALPHWVNSGTQLHIFNTRLPQSLWWS